MHRKKAYGFESFSVVEIGLVCLFISGESLKEKRGFRVLWQTLRRCRSRILLRTPGMNGYGYFVNARRRFASKNVFSNSVAFTRT